VSVFLYVIRIASGCEFLVRCSYLEIYNEEVRDLLASNPDKKLELKEDPNKGVFVKDLTEVVVGDEAMINQVMEKGLEHRSVAATAMNDTSSRSHAIFSIWVEVSETDAATQKEMIRVGKLNLVDLAGSERQKKTGASGDRLKEGSKINLSLSALGNVISALVDGKGKHIPYRDSKLTRLLQVSRAKRAGAERQNRHCQRAKDERALRIASSAWRSEKRLFLAAFDPAAPPFSHMRRAARLAHS